MVYGIKVEDVELRFNFKNIYLNKKYFLYFIIFYKISQLLNFIVKLPAIPEPKEVEITQHYLNTQLL
jgi:hypothetical protein